MATYDRRTQDVSNLVSLEHLNLTVSDQQLSTLFYVVGLGLTRDPYVMIGLENMWANIGHQQFHLPTRTTSQVMRGRIGLVVPSVEELEARLMGVKDALGGTQFAYERADANLDVTGPWGNRFRCHPASERMAGARLGLEYLIFNVPVGTAEGITRFYADVIGASAEVVERRGAPAARVLAGRHQSLIFRETEEVIEPYDGHHVAVYIADFSGPHEVLAEMGLISEESNDSQYRFVDIVDPINGEKLFELEHEVRSMVHPMYGRELVNRDPHQTLGRYQRGADALQVG